MKAVIHPISKEEIKKELTPERFVRKTNKGSNEIYCFTAKDSPLLMREVGRLREITFRSAGGGTGEEVDIDKFDTAEIPYHQLIVWDPKEEQILGGYRYFIGKMINENQESHLATERLFSFSNDFNNNYLPKTIELGRSFVQPAYQSIRMGRKSLYALDNLWDGLGALTVNHPDIEYFFGKVTMYTSFNIDARNYILYFMKLYFNDPDNLISPINPISINLDKEEVENIFTGKNYKEDYKILSKLVREKGENIPPLVNAYMSLSPTMRTFGTSINEHFGGVEETAILIKLSDIYEAKKARHISTYIPHIYIKKHPIIKKIENFLNEDHKKKK
jgi:hypothetical protein